jgi:hypothetical protein
MGMNRIEGIQEALVNRLRVLEDREEIRQLLTDYGRHLDQRDFASFSRLFAEKEGEWIGGMGKAKSAAGIRTFMEATIGANAGDFGKSNYHLFSNENIVINGDTAGAASKWMFIVQGESGHPQLFYLGHYEDSLVREDGRWKFLQRTVTMDIPGNAPTI